MSRTPARSPVSGATPPGPLKADVCRAALGLLRSLAGGDAVTWQAATTGTFARAEPLTAGAYARAVDWLVRTGGLTVDVPNPVVGVPLTIPPPTGFLTDQTRLLPGVAVIDRSGQRLRVDLDKLPERLRDAVRMLPAAEKIEVEVVAPDESLLRALEQYLVPVDLSPATDVPSWDDTSRFLTVRGRRFLIHARWGDLTTILTTFETANPPWPPSVDYGEMEDAYKPASRASERLRSLDCPLSFHAVNKGKGLCWRVAPPSGTGPARPPRGKAGGRKVSPPAKPRTDR